MLVEAAMHDPVDQPLLKVPAAQIAGEQAAPPIFVATTEEQTRITALINEAGDASAADPVVLLNPNASDLLPLRKWERARFAELGGESSTRILVRAWS